MPAVALAANAMGDALGAVTAAAVEGGADVLMPPAG